MLTADTITDEQSVGHPIPYLSAVRVYHILGADELWWGAYVRLHVRLGLEPPPHPKLRLV